MATRLNNITQISTCPDAKAKKVAYRAKTEKIVEELEELQNLMYAESKHSLLIILQGMDASGKDGVVRKVFKSFNPMGCRVIPFKRPTEEEFKHDFLWRIHRAVPGKGMIHIFNRSHYEDVLIQRVHRWIDKRTLQQRFDHINNFEQLLVDSGTTILKFYLHISKEEQLLRLKERLSDDTKKWKYNEGDIKEREYWDNYMEAYQDVFDKCSKAAPWHIIPSDKNWYKEYLIGEVVAKTLRSFNMQYPGFKPENRFP